MVRNELDNLLKESPPYGRTPEPSRVSRFLIEWEHTGHGARACDATTADFMINITGEPRSPWNISAGRVFVDHFVQKMEYDDTQETRKAIEKAFTNRIRSFRSRHKQEALSRADRASERSKHSRQQRKYQVGLLSLVHNGTTHLQSSCFYAAEALPSSLIHLKVTLISWMH